VATDTVAAKIAEKSDPAQQQKIESAPIRKRLEFISRENKLAIAAVQTSPVGPATGSNSPYFANLTESQHHPLYCCCIIAFLGIAQDYHGYAKN
jgi:hypothetical protein